MKIIYADQENRNQPSFSFSVELQENDIYLYVTKDFNDTSRPELEVSVDVSIDPITFQATCEPLEITFHDHDGTLLSLSRSPDMSPEEKLEIERLSSEFVRANYEEILSYRGNDNMQFLAQ
jgi:hypothetical protein